MSEASKQVARKWLDAMNRRDKAAFAALLSDDFQYSGMGRTPKEMAVRWNKDTMIDMAMNIAVKTMKVPVTMKILSEMSEGNRVAMETEGYSETLEGKIYANAYCFLLEIKGDQVKAVHDYCCTHTAMVVRNNSPITTGKS